MCVGCEQPLSVSGFLIGPLEQKVQLKKSTFSWVMSIMTLRQQFKNREIPVAAEMQAPSLANGQP